jgi:hypothetical protein
MEFFKMGKIVENKACFKFRCLPAVIPADLLSGNLAVNRLSMRFPIKAFGNDRKHAGMTA